MYPSLVPVSCKILAGGLHSVLFPGGWTTALGGGFMSLDNETGGIICVVACHDGGLCL